MAWPTPDRDPRKVPPLPPPPAPPQPPTRPRTVGTYNPPPVYYPPPGGGGGGGGGAPSDDYAGLPTQYVAGLRQFVGDPATFYGSRGTEKQAQQDYYNMMNAWAQRAGVPITPDDWSRVWGTLNAYRTGFMAPQPTRVFTMSDAFNFLNRMLVNSPSVPQNAFLRTGEI